MSKLDVVGSIFATAPLWIGLLCAVLEVCFKMDTRTILIVAVGGTYTLQGIVYKITKVDVIW